MMSPKTQLLSAPLVINTTIYLLKVYMWISSVASRCPARAASVRAYVAAVREKTFPAPAESY